MRQIQAKDLRDLRKELWLRQGRKCPVLNKCIPLEHAVVDHKHKTKAQEVGDEGAGLIRGVLHKQANVIEGKIANAWKRYGMHKFGVSIPEFLRNLADYLEQEPLQLIHPNEKTKVPRLMKSSYNKLKGMNSKNPTKKKFPPYPKSGRLTKDLEWFFEHHELEPKFY